ncbi:MAG: hypothetical protein AAGJ38_04045 [Planctomycetota bacterium]
MIVLLGGSFPASPQNANQIEPTARFAVESEVEWHGLRLNASVISHTRVLWHPEHEPLLRSLEAALIEHTQSIESQVKALAELETHRDEVIAWLGARIGLDDPSQTAGEQVFTSMLDLYREMNASLARATVVLIPRQEAIRLLGEGVTIVGFARSSDGQELWMELDEKDLVELSEMVLPLRLDNADTVNKPTTVFRALRGFDMWPGVLLHETAEFMILARAIPKSRQPNLRWFSDGMANALAIRGLTHFGHDAFADRFESKWRDDAKNVDPTKAYLAYWLNTQYTPVFNSYYEQRLTSARYALATVLCDELLESIGEQAARKILDAYLARPDRSVFLLDAVRDVGGEAAAERVLSYQPTQNRDELLAIHEALLEQAYRERNLLIAERHLMRFIELDVAHPKNRYFDLMVQLAKLIEETQGRIAAEQMLTAAQSNLLGLGMSEEAVAALRL